MRYWRVVGSLVVLVAGLCLSSCAWSAVSGLPDWMIRPGTIEQLLMSQSGHAILDCESVARISKNGRYIVLKEPFSDATIIAMLDSVPSSLHYEMVVDCEADVTTLPGPTGYQALVNCQLYAYALPDGTIIDRPDIVKGLFTPSAWWGEKVCLTGGSTQAESFNPVRAMDDSSPEPNPSPAPADMTYYPTIGAILNADPPLAEDALVQIQCVAIADSGVDSDGFNYLDASDSTGQIRIYAAAAASVQSGDRVNQAGGQIQFNAGTPTICVDEGPGFDDTQPGGVLNIVHQAGIPWSKTFADGTQLGTALADKMVVTTYSGSGGADFPAAFYMEEQGRGSGILVRYSGGTALDRGDIVTVSGTVSTDSDGEREILASEVSSTAGNGPPGALGMGNAAVGGAAFNVLTPGPGSGLNNLGVLVKAWGVVTGVDSASGCFYVDDGRSLNDGSGLIGLRVAWDWDTCGKAAITPPTQGDYVTVTGISGSEDVGGYLVRTLRLRDSNDVTTMVASPDSSLDDISLPTANLNGVNRCNIRWACTDSSGCGDIFTPSGSGSYVIDTLRLWIVPSIPASPAYDLGDYFQSITLYTGTSAGLSHKASGTFTAGTSGTHNPHISFLRVNYVNSAGYQEANQFDQLWQVDFRGLNWQVSGGTTYSFGVYAVPLVDRLSFLHATRLTQGSSGMFQFNPANPAAGTTACRLRLVGQRFGYQRSDFRASAVGGCERWKGKKG